MTTIRIQEPSKESSVSTEAFVTFVQVHVVAGAEDAFLAASLDNSASSRQEPGVTRFDVVQQMDDPTWFQLVEGYVSEDAVAAHRASAHYAAWREAVDDLMAEPRRAVRYVARER
jgi:quinol monooxygenase YgiN